VFRSLDFIYLPAPEFDSALSHYVNDLHAQVVWRVRGMGTVVAMVRLAEAGPALLLAEHLHDQPPILVFRVDDLTLAQTRLEADGIQGESLELPHGPCFRFDMPGGQRMAIYQLTRPEANTMWDGRMDP
jgi:hypothetical protein